MRAVAIVLVVLGCLGLGRYGSRVAGGPDLLAAVTPDVPPAVAGIALVSGLLLLALNVRRS